MSGQVPPQALQLRADALADGLVDGADFAVAFVTPRHGSECVLFTGTPDGFVVLYTDQGAVRTLLSTPSFADARDAFLLEARWLAAERGRGPYAGQARPLGTESWSVADLVATFDEVQARTDR